MKRLLASILAASVLLIAPTQAQATPGSSHASDGDKVEESADSRESSDLVPPKDLPPSSLPLKHIFSPGELTFVSLMSGHSLEGAQVADAVEGWGNS